MAPQDVTNEDITDRHVYLSDDFDASRLKVAQLRLILLTHDVKHTTSMKKHKLEELFRDEVHSRRAELRKRYWNIVPSSVNFEPATPPPPTKSRSTSANRKSKTEKGEPKPDTAKHTTKDTTKDTAKDTAKDTKEAHAAKPEIKPPKTNDEPLVLKSPRRGTHTKVRGAQANSAARGRSASVANSDAESEAEADAEPHGGTDDEPRDESLQLSPRALRAQRRRIASDTLKESKVPELKPAPRAASSRSSSRASSVVPEAPAEAPAKAETKAELEPPAAAAAAAAAPPTSPRRRRANRKVEIPAAFDHADHAAPPPKLADVKLKAPRAPKRKLRDDEDDEDDVKETTTTSSTHREPKSEKEEASFVQDNVFQRSTPSKRVKKEHSRPSSSARSAESPKPKPEVAPFLAPHQSALPAFMQDAAAATTALDRTLDRTLDRSLDLDSMLTPGVIDSLEHAFQQSESHMPDEFFPDDAAEAETAAALTPEASEFVIVQPAPSAAADYESAGNSNNNNNNDQYQPSYDHGDHQEHDEPEYDHDDHDDDTHSQVSPRTQPPLRSGTAPGTFLPKFSSRSVPAAEKKDPNATSTSFYEQHQQSNYRSAAGDQTAPDFSYLPDAESLAASEVHNILGSLPELTRVTDLNIPKPPIPRPRLPRVRLPRVRLPRVRLPRVRLPRVRLPRLRLPTLPRLRRPRLPNVRLPRLKLPTVRLPRIDVVSPLKALVRLVSSVLFWSLVLLWFSMFVSLLSWFRHEYGAAQFCGTGAIQFPTYPAWTETDTGYAGIAHVQSRVRSALDLARPQCVPCPEHGQCYQDRVVVCDSEFQYVPSALSQLGVWPFPPSCEHDWELKRKVDVFSDAVRQHLQERRAEALCSDEGLSGGAREEDVVSKTAVSSDELRAHLYAKKWQDMPDDVFDDLWQRTVATLDSKYPDVYEVSFNTAAAATNRGESKQFSTQQLEQHILTPTQQTHRDNTRSNDFGAGAAHEVAQSEAADDVAALVVDSPTARYFVSRSDAYVPLSCQLRRTVLAWYARNRHTINMMLGALLVASIFAVHLQRSCARRRRDAQQARALIEFVKEQRELAAASAATHAYVKVTDMRRRVLPEGRRRRAREAAHWDRIQKLVESDPDIRCRQIEVNGDIHRVWEWMN